MMWITEEIMKRRIQKVKLGKDKKIFIAYQERSNEKRAWDEYTINCIDIPRPELYKTFEKLNAQVIDICEMPETDLQKITTTGMSLSYNDETGGWGVVLTAQKKLQYNPEPLNINTPYKPYEAAEGNEDMEMSPECYEAVSEVIEEACRYIDGDRAEMNLFAEPEKKEGENIADDCDTEHEGRSGKNNYCVEYGVPAEHQEQCTAH